MNHLNELPAFLATNAVKFSQLIDHIAFDQTNHESKHLVGLLRTTNARASGVALLVREKHEDTISPVIRSMLEAQVDISNLVRIPGYYYQLRQEYLSRFLKAMKRPASGDDSLTTARSSGVPIDDGITLWEKEKKDLERLGYRGLNIEQKFALANMEQDYVGIYGQLCAETHNRTDAILARVTRLDIGVGLELLGISEPYDNVRIELIVACETLCRANGIVHEHFQSPCAEECLQITSNLRSCWVDKA